MDKTLGATPDDEGTTLTPDEAYEAERQGGALDPANDDDDAVLREVLAPVEPEELDEADEAEAGYRESVRPALYPPFVRYRLPRGKVRVRRTKRVELEDGSVEVTMVENAKGEPVFDEHELPAIWRTAIVTNGPFGESLPEGPLLNLTVFLDGLSDRKAEVLRPCQEHGCLPGGRGAYLFVGSAPLGVDEGCWQPF